MTYPEYNNWVGSRVLFQEGFEGDGAGGEDDLVSLDLFTVTGDRDVHEIILIPQILKCAFSYKIPLFVTLEAPLVYVAIFQVNLYTMHWFALF